MVGVGGGDGDSDGGGLQGFNWAMHACTSPIKCGATGKTGGNISVCIGDTRAVGDGV